MTTAAKTNSSWQEYGVVLATALLVIVAGLGSFGFWEGAELRMAGIARGDAAGEIARPALQTALPRWGFRTLGGSEAGGRLPGALYALAATLMLAMAVGRVADARAGMWTGIVYATMPLVFMNARQLFGGGIAQSSFTLGLSGAMIALWARPPPGREAMWNTGRWVLLALVLLGAPGAGWMLGVVPVLLGVGIAALLRWRHEVVSNRAVGLVLAIAGLVLAIACGISATRPVEAFNSLVGAAPDMRGPATLPTYETFIEHIGHGLFPWTGIVAFAVVRLLVAPPIKGAREIGPQGEGVDEPDAWRESGVRIAAFVAMVLAFGLQSFHTQLFGMTPFIAVAPLAVAAGLALRDAEREAQPWRLITAGATFFTVLMMRDYLLFPKSSYSALGLAEGGPAFPTGATSSLGAAFHGGLGSFFSARAMSEMYFVVEAALFIVIALSALFQGAGVVKPIPWARPFTWIGEVEHAASAQMNDEVASGKVGWLHRVSGLGLLAHLRILLGGFAAILMLVFGPIAAFARLVTPARVAFSIFAALPIAIVVATYAVVILWNVFAWLGATDKPVGRVLGSRIAYVPIAGFLIAVIIAHLFVPALSRHLSPRDVWLATAHERHGDEPVARFGTPPNDPAPGFYTRFEVRPLPSEREAVDWLLNRSPRHLLVASTGADVFPPLNRSYRRSFPQGERQNIPVLDATNSNLFLATSDLGDRPSRNPLDRIVMTTDSLTSRADRYRVHGVPEGGNGPASPARLDDAIEYVGFNIEGEMVNAPGSRFEIPVVPVGGAFTITYHFHSLREVAGNYQMFIHVDGQCPRVNGDHDPAEGKYPVRFWLPGDYVHDVHGLRIPGYCRPGRYQVFMGFFQGDNRMHVNGGDHDRENRIVAATLDVR